MGNTAAFGPTLCVSADAGGGEPDGEERVPDGVERRLAHEDRRLADGERHVAADSLEPLLDVLAEIALEALSGDER